VPPVMASLNVTGNMEPDVLDAAKVSLSFFRAHAAWVRESFGLLCDPRDRHGRDYIFSINRLNVRSTGQSAGAAYAGSPFTFCCDLNMGIIVEVFTSGDSSVLPQWPGRYASPGSSVEHRPTSSVLLAYQVRNGV
jgi:hypothetical protein